MLPPLDPLTAEFWANERNLLWDDIDEILLLALLAGGASGLGLLPAGAQQLLNVEAFNQQAISYLRQYQLTTISGITETTRRQVVEAIYDWMMSGEPLSALEARLAPIFGNVRAAAIAATEITRIYAEGNMMMWRASGVIGAKRWETAMDERVCPICGPMQGTIVSLESQFEFGAETLANSPQMKALIGIGYTPERGLRRANSLIKNIGSSVMAPPAHVNCRCYLRPIVSEQLFSDELERILNG